MIEDRISTPEVSKALSVQEVIDRMFPGYHRFDLNSVPVNPIYQVHHGTAGIDDQLRLGFTVLYEYPNEKTGRVFGYQYSSKPIDDHTSPVSFFLKVPFSFTHTPAAIPELIKYTTDKKTGILLESTYVPKVDFKARPNFFNPDMLQQATWVRRQDRGKTVLHLPASPGERLYATIARCDIDEEKTISVPQFVPSVNSEHLLWAEAQANETIQIGQNQPYIAEYVEEALELFPEQDISLVTSDTISFPFEIQS
jgi:hypothetical protein